jgi:hypothetical protein
VSNENRVGVSEPAAIKQHVPGQKHGGGEGRENAIVEYPAYQPGERQAEQQRRRDGDQPRCDQDVLLAQNARQGKNKPTIKAGPPGVLTIDRGAQEMACISWAAMVEAPSSPTY